MVFSSLCLEPKRGYSLKPTRCVNNCFSIVGAHPFIFFSYYRGEREARPSIDAFKEAFKVAGSISLDDTTSDERSSQLKRYVELLEDLRQSALIGTRHGRRLRDSSNKKLDHLRAELVWTQVEGHTSKGSNGRAHGNHRPKREGTILGSSLSPKFHGKLVDAIACALNSSDRQLVFNTIQKPLEKRADELDNTAPRISKALKDALRGEFFGFNKDDEQKSFRVEIASIVKAALNLDVLFATNVEEALLVWREIDDMHKENKKKLRKITTKIGLFAGAFGNWGALRVDRNALEQQKSAFEEKMRIAKILEERAKQIAANNDNKASLKTSAIEAKMDLVIESALKTSEAPMPEESEESRGRRLTRSRGKGISSSSAPPFVAPRVSPLVLNPLPDMMDEEEKSSKPTSPILAPKLSSRVSSAHPKLSGRSIVATFGRFSVTTRPDVVRFRDKGGLSRKDLVEVKSILDGFVDDISHEASVATGLASLSVQLVLDKVEDCPEFSLSSNPKQYS